MSSKSTTPSGQVNKATLAIIALVPVAAGLYFVWQFLGPEPKVKQEGPAGAYSASATNAGKTPQAVMPAALKGTLCPMMTEAGIMCEGVGPEGTLLRRDPTADPSLHGCVFPGFDEIDDEGRPVYKEVTFYLRGKKIPRGTEPPEKSDAVWLVPNAKIDLIASLAPNCGPA